MTVSPPISNKSLLAMYRMMVRIRRFEDTLYNLFLQGLVPGTLHQYQGQEAAAAGVCTALRNDDLVFSTHRPVGHAIAKGVPLEAIAGELWGKVTGCVGGKGGQMHLADPTVGFMPSNAIVGANIPIAVGAAIGFAIRGLDRVAVSFFGDGASNIGAFHEGLNFAAVRVAPVVFICENNQYAASTHISLTTKIKNIADRAAAYGMPGAKIDGMDVLAVHDAAKKAVDRARAGGGPTLLELSTYRYMGHSRGDPGNYRRREELEAWRRRDPLQLFRQSLVGEYKMEEEDLVVLEERCQEEVEAAVRSAQEAPAPAAEEVGRHVFAEYRSEL
jgi:TPP-dependent pyruvate/acetoin dehydrogenase alpha subunit